MPHYMFQGNYTTEAIRALTARPEDRHTESLGRRHTRVVDDLAAAALQLRSIARRGGP